jgi:hypothetical protein
VEKMEMEREIVMETNMQLEKEIKMKINMDIKIAKAKYNDRKYNYEFMSIINKIKNTLNNEIEDYNDGDDFNDDINKKQITKLLYKINTIQILSYNNIKILNCNYNDKDKNVIIDSLNYIYNKNNYIKYYENLCKIFVNIIYNAYKYSEYDILLINIPECANSIYNTKIVPITAFSIFDTVEHYIGENTVSHVFKFTIDKYLIKLNNKNDSLILNEKINNMLIGNNIIRVIILENINSNIGSDDLIFEEEKIFEKSEKMTNEIVNDVKFTNKNNYVIDNDIKIIFNKLLYDVMYVKNWFHGLYNRLYNKLYSNK